MLLHNHPNPLNSFSTEIQFTIPYRQLVTINVHNVLQHFLLFAWIRIKWRVRIPYIGTPENMVGNDLPTRLYLIPRAATLRLRPKKFF